MSFLIVSDIDHTLLNEDGELLSENIEALAEARAQGAKVVLATARSFAGALKIHKALDLDTPLIVSNGTIIATKEGRTLHTQAIKNETVVDVFKLYKETEKAWILRTPQFPYFHPELAANGGPFGVEENRKIMNPDNMLEHIQNNGHTPIVAASLFGNDIEGFFNANDWRKMGLVADFYPPSHYYDKDGMSVMSDKASKGNAAAWLQKHLGLNDWPVLALGDNVADATMFGLGIGVAPENAKDEVKEQADWIAPHCDDGAVVYAGRKAAASGHGLSAQHFGYNNTFETVMSG